MRQVKASNRRLGSELDRAGRVGRLLHACYGGPSGAGMPRDTGDYPIAATGTLQVVHRESAVKLQAAVRSGHPRASTLHLDCPEKCIDTAFDDLLDSARPAVARIT